MTHRHGPAASIEEAEEPQGDFVAEAELDVVGSDESVRDIADLGEALASAADFKEVTSVNDEITVFSELGTFGRNVPCAEHFDGLFLARNVPGDCSMQGTLR